MNNTEFTTNINNCARCGENHTNLLFKKFTNDCNGFTHFAICPTNQEPILLKIVEDNEDK